MDSILKHNLRLMQATGRGGMAFLLGRESFGAKETFEGVKYQAANFFYDADGKIIEFTNAELPDSDVEIYRGAFLIELDIKRQRAGIRYILVSNDSPRAATVKLVDSAKELNKVWGWPDCKISIGDIDRLLGQK